MLVLIGYPTAKNGLHTHMNVHMHLPTHVHTNTHAFKEGLCSGTHMCYKEK